MTGTNSIYQLPVSWEYTGSNNVTMDPFIGYSIGSSLTPVSFTLPATMNIGDIFAATSPFTTFTITRNNSNQKIYFNGNQGNIITMTNAGSTIFLVCSLSVGVTPALNIMNSSGAFTLT